MMDFTGCRRMQRLAEPDIAVIAEPAECVLQTFLICQFRKVLAGMGGAAFRPPDRRTQADACLGQEFERLGEIGIETLSSGRRRKGHTAHHFDGTGELVQPLIQPRAVAKYGAVTLHGQPDFPGAGPSPGPAPRTPPRGTCSKWPEQARTRSGSPTGDRG